MTSKEKKEFLQFQIKSCVELEEFSKKEKIDKTVLRINKQLLDFYTTIEKDLEVLDWLIEKMYVAPELLELKVCPKHNEAKSILKYHNGIETRDERFWNYIDRIHELKYKR